VIKVSALDSSRVEISWLSVSGATSYELYQDNVLIQTFNPTTLKYVIVGLDIRVSYNFSLVTVNNELRSAFTEVKNVRTKLLAPTNLVLSSNEISTISYSFDPAKDATNYEIYRSTSLSGSYSLIYTGISVYGSKALITDCDIKINQEYYYKIRSVLRTPEGVLYSDFTPIQSKKSTNRVATMLNGNVTIDFVNLNYTYSSYYIYGYFKITNYTTKPIMVQVRDEIVNDFGFSIIMSANVPPNSSITDSMRLSKSSLANNGSTKINNITMKMMVCYQDYSAFYYTDYFTMIFN